ncbi:LEAF RUST 10 DISEASE-RESISTANCE LOCUS RECEPTOR-LIKE PROTEIN KINASE-like 2.4 [Silene latifolia]|uniref:LEAF RUST 10 DISEASE-RESISTANCE LOCUS RECEPTOR-LIKE PROTEIN KINASE-like 2.4 n=1 Tax=Silene latifolia TaxID=37657 RepID=UPI003D782099
MRYRQMISPTSSLQVVSLFIVIVFVGLSSSDSSVDYWYKTCSSAFFTCGELKNVGYPFWGDGRPQYCGHSALELQCKDDPKGPYPYLQIGPRHLEIYSVVSIASSGYSVTLELRGTPQNSCGSYGRDFDGILQFSESVEKINVLYKCNKGVVPNHRDGSVSCYENSSRFPVYYRNNNSGQGQYSSCSSSQVPVFKKELDLYNKGNKTVSQILQEGFEVNYEYSLDCVKCYKSGCICGSSSSSVFLCLCGKVNKLRRLIIVGSASLAVGIGILIVIAWYLRKKKSSRKFATFWKSEATTCPNVDAFLQIYGSFSVTRHTYKNLKKITNDFKEKLGEGGYAVVYKGMLNNGCHVAVKVLKQLKGTGEDFLNEVASISRTNHVNVVTLLGFCFEGNKRALIYEYLPNGSLEKFTYHGASASSKSLPWEALLNIAIGIAKGLDYLHRGCNARILHFDIKPHNILLDQDFTPKISDFGLARLCPLKESTISMMEARGTIGYIAPEVFCRTFGRVSHKSDVYSFGMMILDMACGRNNLSAEEQISSDQDFPNWIYDRLELEEEASFQGTTNDKEKALQRKMILVSLWCIQSYPSNRPSMSTVVQMLQGCPDSIQMPPRPYLSSPPRLASVTSGTITQTQ